MFWIFQQLLHPIAFSLILTSYNIFIGKLFLVILQRLKLLSFPVYPEEKRGQRPTDFPAKFPNALALLLVNQLKKLKRYNQNRKEIARYYRDQLQGMSFILSPDAEGAMYLRFPLLHANPTEILSQARKKHVYLGNWYHHVVDPKGVDFVAIGYQPGSCPKAEQAAKKIMNLPTRISLNDAKKVMETLNV